jgi:tetratricopeptide (TPR) repeat protein
MGYRRELAMLCASINQWQSFGGDYSDEYGQKAISLAEELGDPPALAWVYRVMGNTRFYRAGRHWTQQSIPYYLRAAEISERIGDVQYQALALCRLAQAHRRLGQDERAIETWGKALDIAAATRSIYPLILSSQIIRIHGECSQEDEVMQAFSRIMRAFASLEIDEESQAWALISGPLSEDIYTVHQAFRDGCRSLGKEPEFPSIAQRILANLLRDVNSRPQRAWYHTQLMNLHLELGDMRSAEDHAKKAVSIIEEMDRPDSMARLYPAYLLLGDICSADALAGRFLARNVWSAPSYLSYYLREADLTYSRFGQSQAFDGICDDLERQYGEGLRRAGINQLLLESATYSEDFPTLEFEDSFDWENTETVFPPWRWIDPEGVPSYVIHRDPARMEMSVAGGSGLRLDVPHSAPRLSQSISGDFAVETLTGAENSGGLFVSKDEKIVTLQHQSGLLLLTSEEIIAGRGLLDAEALILRLERKGKMFRAYCSGDGQNWYSCGWTEMKMEDPVHVGIFASCPRNVPQTVTSFDYVKIFRTAV